MQSAKSKCSNRALRIAGGILATVALGIAGVFIEGSTRAAEGPTVDPATIKRLCKVIPEPKHGRAAVDTPPVVLAVESIMRRGEFYDVLFVYGYGDNYARAEEIGRALTEGKPFPQRFRVISC
jgi:hypothetical protein